MHPGVMHPGTASAEVLGWCDPNHRWEQMMSVTTHGREPSTTTYHARGGRAGRSALVVCALALVIATVSCSNDMKAFCDQFNAFVASINTLKQAVDSKDVEATKTAAQNAKAEFDKLPSAAKEQVDAQVKALQSSLVTLQAAVDGAQKSGDPSANLGPVSAAITGVDVAIESLKSAASC
jgi:hypothetical protein